MVLGKLLVPGHPTVWIGQGRAVLAVGAVGDCLNIFSPIYHFSLLYPSLWETARYRLKYCLKGPKTTITAIFCMHLIDSTCRLLPCSITTI